MTMTNILALFAVFFAFSLMSVASSTAAPDAIFLNGDIYTQATPARAQAMAVRDGRIVAIGTNDAIRKLKGSHTEVVDLGGQFVMPGFNDAHCHLQSGGFEQMNVNLVGRQVAGRNAAEYRHARENDGCGRLDRRRRLGPYVVVKSAAADAAGSRRGDRRPSRNLRARRWTHRGRELGGAAGRRRHRTDGASAGRRN